MLRLNRPLRPTASADPDDVLAAKRVFLDLGYYDPPTGELHPWPDAPLFQAIRSFQVDNELAPDAEMLPGGPTESALNALSAPEPDLDRRALAQGRIREQDAASDSESWRQSLERRTGHKLTPAIAPATVAAGVALAEAGKVVLPRLLGGAAAAAALNAVRRDRPVPPGASLMEAEGWRGDARFEALPPQKAEPMRGPSAEEIDRLNKELNRPTVFPAAEPIPIQPGDLPAELPDIPQILIFPDMSGEIEQIIIIERKGNAETKAQLDRIRDWFLDRGWTHVKGGRRKLDNGKIEEEEELWIPGPQHAFEDPATGKRPDGRKGGRFVDLTMRSPDGKIVHIQTVTVDKHGKPVQAELDAAEAIRRATGDHVILIPKRWQLREVRGSGSGGGK